MTDIGKKIRMERIFDRISKNTVIVPMIHGAGAGPTGETVDMSEEVDRFTRSGANAVVLHKDVVTAGHRGRGKDVGLIVHLSSSAGCSDAPRGRAVVCSVKEAVSLGADAVSIYVNPEKGKESQVKEEFAAVVDQSNEYGMPLLVMVSNAEKGNEYDAGKVAYCARLANELGADIVNVNYTGSPETFRDIVAACNVPVLIADGPETGSEKELLEMVEGAMMAGAAGIAIGSNVFKHDDLTTIVGKMSKIVHKVAHVEDFYPEKDRAAKSFWGD